MQDVLILRLLESLDACMGHACYLRSAARVPKDQIDGCLQIV